MHRVLRLVAALAGVLCLHSLLPLTGFAQPPVPDLEITSPADNEELNHGEKLNPNGTCTIANAQIKVRIQNDFVDGMGNPRTNVSEVTVSADASGNWQYTTPPGGMTVYGYALSGSWSVRAWMLVFPAADDDHSGDVAAQP